MLKNSILFVGFNLSYHEGADKMSAINKDLLINPSGTLDSESNIKIAIEYEKEAIGNNAANGKSSYYGQFPKIVCNVYSNRNADGKWSHLDVLPIREKISLFSLVLLRWTRGICST